ncbi:MAG: hypothetical protein V9E94_12665 [Microthrixaceae bacterium]
MGAGPVLSRPTAVAVFLVVLLVPLTLTLAGPPDPVGAQGCGPAPAGRVAAMVTIDRGTGSPGSRCVVVSHGATGLDALRAAGHEVRLDGGFVCAIDGLPATGCANKPDAGNAYWRYWHAPANGGAWSYSQVGAGGYRLPTRCAVEGWVWSDSPSSDTPPRIAAPVVTCEAPATTAPPATAPPVTAPPGTGPSGPAGSGAGTPGAGTSSGTTPPAPGGGGASPGSGAGSGAAGSVDGSAAATPPVDVAGETTVPGEVASDPSASTGSSGQADAGDRTVADGTEDASARASNGGSGPAAGGSNRGSAAPWGVLVALLLMAVLGGAAWWRSRLQREDA